MTEKEIKDKIGAMHLRLLDDSRHYAELVGLMTDYAETSGVDGLAVNKALTDGLNNAERYLQLESALSPKAIVIENRKVAKGLAISKADAEGRYRIFLVTDEGKRLKLRFDRKQSQLLYILIALCYQKNGLMADFFSTENPQSVSALDTVVKLIKLIYPSTDDKDAMTMAKGLAYDRFFTDSLQKMKYPIVDCLKTAKLEDDLYWFMPYSIQLKKKRLYKLHISQPSIVFPTEFLEIADALPNAADFLEEEDIEIDQLERDRDNEFAWWKEAADRGEAKGLYYMGVYYGTGDVVSQDYQKSIAYFKQAEEKGFVDATFQLGVYHMFGFGVEKDIYEALKYFERAAKNGHAEAAAWAGQIYERGSYGVPTDYKKAFNLYKIAAEQDHEEGMWFVIQGYLLGNGVKKDEKKAHEWFLKAKELGYVKISVLYGIHLYNKGDKDSLETALRLFLDGCNAEMPVAFFMMAKMTLKGYQLKNDTREEVREWLLKAAYLGDQASIDIIREQFYMTYLEHRSSWERKASIREVFIPLVMKMDQMQKESFIRLVDAYREKWHKSYVAEMCKQLSIHMAPEGSGEDWKPERHITVRKSFKGKNAYEIVLTLANGTEVIVDKINPNSLLLFVLTVICSFKSGYTTLMAKSEACRPILRELVMLVMDKRNNIDSIDNYIEGMMGYEKEEVNKKTEDYYKQYSNIARNAIKDAVGSRDDKECYLFKNIRVAGRKNLRVMTLEPEFIVLPPELMDLAERMPDAYDILQNTEYQDNTPILRE